MMTPFQRYRLYEMLPGILIWGTFIVSIVLSIVEPLSMIYLILVFDLYWVLRVIYFSFYLILSWRRYRHAIRIAWFQRLIARFSDWQRTINVVFLPVYNEGWEVVDATLQALAKSTYPADKLYVVISGEARQMAHWQSLQEKIAIQYKEVFADILLYTHPKDLPDEIPGKGSNIHYAEGRFIEYSRQHGWKDEDVIVSVFDIDTIVHPEYIAHLTFLYRLHPSPTRSSFQPVTLYNNNLWESPAILRIMAMGTSFWMLFSLARLDNLVTFSSHSMSLKAIVDSGGHAKHIVSEDSRIFFDCWLHYNGDYEVTPLYIPVSMDTVRDDSMGKSLKNLYLQQRRWAWGTEHVPYLLKEFPKHPEISWWKKVVILFHELEGKWSWAVVAPFITLMGTLPLWFAGKDLRQSALFFNTPQILKVLMTLAMIGLLVSAVMSMLMLPPPPAGHRSHRTLLMLLQWALLPVSLIVFSSLPCLDAVTRLMRGQYLGFNVSTKKRS